MLEKSAPPIRAFDKSINKPEQFPQSSVNETVEYGVIGPAVTLEGSARGVRFHPVLWVPFSNNYVLGRDVDQLVQLAQRSRVALMSAKTKQLSAQRRRNDSEHVQPVEK